MFAWLKKSQLVSGIPRRTAPATVPERAKARPSKQIRVIRTFGELWLPRLSTARGRLKAMPATNGHREAGIDDVRRTERPCPPLSNGTTSSIHTPRETGVNGCQADPSRASPSPAETKHSASLAGFGRTPGYSVLMILLGSRIESDSRLMHPGYVTAPGPGARSSQLTLLIDPPHNGVRDQKRRRWPVAGRGFRVMVAHCLVVGGTAHVM